MIDFAAVAKFPNLLRSIRPRNLNSSCRQWPPFFPQRPSDEKGLREGVIKPEEVAATARHALLESKHFFAAISLEKSKHFLRMFIFFQFLVNPSQDMYSRNRI